MKTGRLERDSAEVIVDLVPESMNRSGYVHGGMLFAMADFCGGLTARTDGREYVTQSAHISYITGVKEGRIRAVGSVLHRGRKTTVVEVHVYSEKDVLLCKVMVSMFCVSE